MMRMRWVLLSFIVSTQSKYAQAVRCVLNNKICECIAADMRTNNEDLLLHCKGATALTLKETDASEENWPTGLNFRSTTTDIVNLTLSNNAFQKIPTNHLPSGLQALNLSGNMIMNITGTSLSHFKELKILDLSYNNISNVDEDAFDGLCGLQKLYLQGNNIYSFRNVYNAVKKVSSLIILDLAENLLDNVFIPVSLKNLKVVNLRSNTILEVSVNRCTYNLPNLQEVDLRDNFLTSFPRSIIDSFNKSIFRLQNNLFECECSVQYKVLENYECINANGTVNFNVDCMYIGNGTETHNTTYTESLILLSDGELEQPVKSESYCSEFHNAPPLTQHEVTEICWDVPEHIGLCDEVQDLIRVTNGLLNLTQASHYNISGLYTYKEYHTCEHRYLYTVTGQVRLQQSTSDLLPCVPREPTCVFNNRSSEVTALQVAWIVLGGCICILAVAVLVKRLINKLAISVNIENVDNIISLQESLPNTRTNEIDEDDVRPKIGVSFVVKNGYLITHGSSLTTNLYDNTMPQNEGEAVEQGYKPFDVDEDGYMIISSLGNDLPVNGYYTYIPNESSNEVFLDSEGHLCLDPSVIPITGNRYTFLILRKDQGELGQLTIHRNKYIQLQSPNNHGGKQNVYRETSSQEDTPGTSTNHINSEVTRSQTRVCFVVINGYLTRGNQDLSLNPDIQSTDILNAAEAIKQGYRSLSIDKNGYLILKANLGKDLLDDPNGYYTYIPNESANKVFVDIDGYLCVNPPVLPITDDGYTCLILRKDQGALGQLTIHRSKYLKLQPPLHHGGKHNVYRETSTQEATPGTSTSDICAEVARSQTRISFAVINGYLNHVNQDPSLNPDIQSTDILQNADEAIKRGYRSLSIDKNGYLIMNPGLGNDLTDDPNGYYTYIPSDSANKVLVDKDGYICVNPPVLPVTDDRNTCLILRKDQGALGQLTIHRTNYIQLQPPSNHGGKQNVYRETSTPEATPCASTNDIDADVTRSKTRISLVVINGYLTRVNEDPSLIPDSQSTDILQNAAEAIKRGYRSLSIDKNGYLIINPSLGEDHIDDPNGYYTYIPNTSANKVDIDIDGYICVDTPVFPITDDGSTCLILRKDQRALGQLTIHRNKYIQLQPPEQQTDDIHIYDKIRSTWDLLRFWEIKEDQHCKES